MTAKELLRRYEARELLFKNVHLRASDLSYQNLRRICLYGADLTDAKLVGTNLADADLHYANLTGSNRQGWSTKEANLWSTFP